MKCHKIISFLDMHKRVEMALIKLISSRLEALDRCLLRLGETAENNRCVLLKEAAILCRGLFRRSCSVPDLR